MKKVSAVVFGALALGLLASPVDARPSDDAPSRNPKECYYDDDALCLRNNFVNDAFDDRKNGVDDIDIENNGRGPESCRTTPGENPSEAADVNCD